MEVDVCDLGEQLARLPAVLGRVLHLEVLALGPGQLLKVEVQHRRQPVYQRLQTKMYSSIYIFILHFIAPVPHMKENSRDESQCPLATMVTSAVCKVLVM